LKESRADVESIDGMVSVRQPDGRTGGDQIRRLFAVVRKSVDSD
jgi:hypothetical protein